MRLDGYGLFFKEMEEIRQALICGSDMYELKYYQYRLFNSFRFAEQRGCVRLTWPLHFQGTHYRTIGST